MALLLSSRGLLDRAKQLTQSGPARSTALITTAGGIGLAAGKTRKTRVVELTALGAGVGAHLIGLHAIGDGALAGGATLLGYKLGAKKPEARLPASPQRAFVAKKKGLLRRG